MTLSSDINKTLKYAKRFGGKLTLNQLHFRLLSDKKYSLEEIKSKTSCLAGRQANFKLQKKENKENDKKIKLAEELVKNHLSKFKDILMVAVTGSVAAENARSEEDIDIFIVCKANSLWWTRLKLRLYIKLWGIPHRRYGHKERANDFCFNLWMEEVDLMVPKLKQNQKNAVDLIMMKVLFGKNNIYGKFIKKNRWAEKYVANGYYKIKTSNFKHQTSKNKTSIITILLNYLAFGGQLLYIRLKGPVRFINLRQAFFHK